MRDADHLLQTGSINGYQWLVSTDRQLDVLECCPDVVLGKYVAITSFDSGPLRLTEGQKSAGWVSQGEVAYSPDIQQVKMVPQAYFSELYVFGAPTLRVEINEEKSRKVDLTKEESFSFLGFEYRRVRSRKGKWRPHFVPKPKKRTALLRKLKEIFRQSVSQPVRRVIGLINPILRGWVNYLIPSI